MGYKIDLVHLKGTCIALDIQLFCYKAC